MFYAPKSHNALAFCSTSTKRFDWFVPGIQIRVECSLSLPSPLVWQKSCRVWCEDYGGSGGGGVGCHYLQWARNIILLSALVGISFVLRYPTTVLTFAYSWVWGIVKEPNPLVIDLRVINFYFSLCSACCHNSRVIFFFFNSTISYTEREGRPW